MDTDAAPSTLLQSTPLKRSSFCSTLMWWTTLAIAVMAVPVLGAALALAATHSALGQIAIFVVTSWLSVWLGMWLMKKANHLHRRQ